MKMVFWMEKMWVVWLETSRIALLVLNLVEKMADLKVIVKVAPKVIEWAAVMA